MQIWRTQSLSEAYNLHIKIMEKHKIHVPANMDLLTKNIPSK